jgi:hypothetical protein
LEPELSQNEADSINANSKSCTALPFADISKNNDETEISDVRDFVMSIFD